MSNENEELKVTNVVEPSTAIELLNKREDNCLRAIGQYEKQWAEAMPELYKSWREAQLALYHLTNARRTAEFNEYWQKGGNFYSS